jgi:HD-GYP domain-containing protein (c-di-GMP phosphodiesterase class II)
MNALTPTGIIGIFPYIISFVFVSGLGIASIMAGWHRAEVRLFVAVAALQVALGAVSLLELIRPGVDAKLFWNALRWPLESGLHVAVLLLAIGYVGLGQRLLNPVSLTAMIVPLAFVIIASMTVVSGISISPLYAYVDRTVGLPFTGIAARPSALALLALLYGYAQSALAVYILARYAVRKDSARRKAAWYILVGCLVCSLGMVASLMPLWSIVGSTLSVYALFSRRLYGTVQMARRAVMDTLMDPVFVLGGDGVVVDCNAAARTLIGTDGGNPIGVGARSLFKDWPSEVIAALAYPEAETELDLPDHEGLPHRSYRITVASSPAKDRSSGWKLLVFNDISGQKSDARNLVSTNEELEFWVRQRTSALRQEVAQRTTAEERLRELNVEMAKTQREILWTLSEVVESRSRETAYHVVRVGEYASILARAYGLPDEEAEIITTAAPMHDVGKIAIPDAILSKPGLLTPEERTIMQRHTVVGKEILGTSDRPLLRAAAVIAFEHHERWDGKGYPLGKSGFDISLSGRIVAICDVFDALYNKRVYKDAWPLEKVLELFRNESGAAFEPQLVDLLFGNLDAILEISRRYADVAEVPTL